MLTFFNFILNALVDFFNIILGCIFIIDNDASHFGDFISAAVRDEAKKGDGATYPGAQDAFAPIQAELEKLAKPQPEPTDYQAEE